jgi:hypothetical protein
MIMKKKVNNVYLDFIYDSIETINHIRTNFSEIENTRGRIKSVDYRNYNTPLI